MRKSQAFVLQWKMENREVCAERMQRAYQKMRQQYEVLQGTMQEKTSYNEIEQKGGET